jgi:hypothetical protein
MARSVKESQRASSPAPRQSRGGQEDYDRGAAEAAEGGGPREQLHGDTGPPNPPQDLEGWGGRGRKGGEEGERVEGAGGAAGGEEGLART